MKKNTEREAIKRKEGEIARKINPKCEEWKEAMNSLTNIKGFGTEI